jgi:phage baseplate assembly protein W
MLCKDEKDIKQTFKNIIYTKIDGDRSRMLYGDRIAITNKDSILESVLESKILEEQEFQYSIPILFF